MYLLIIYLFPCFELFGGSVLLSGVSQVVDSRTHTWVCANGWWMNEYLLPLTIMNSASRFNVHWVYELLLEDPSVFHNHDTVVLLPIVFKVIISVPLV